METKRLKSQCKYGKMCPLENCGYYHGFQNESQVIDSKCTRPCKYALIGCKKMGCTFAHTRDEFRGKGSWEELTKQGCLRLNMEESNEYTRLCKYLLIGCKKEKCTFAHRKEEFRGTGEWDELVKRDTIQPKSIVIEYDTTID